MYGHAGGEHTMRPQFALRNNAVYATPYNHDMHALGSGLGGKPLFRVKDDKWFRTEFHPEGRSEHALYEMRGDNIHTTSFHPQHDPARPVFHIK